MWGDIAMWVIGAIAGAALVYAVVNWDELSDKISSWLHRNGLDKSMLMTALCMIDFHMGRLRRRLVVRKYGDAYDTIIEETYVTDSDEIKAYEKELEGRRKMNKNMMEYL